MTSSIAANGNKSASAGFEILAVNYEDNVLSFIDITPVFCGAQQKQAKAGTPTKTHSGCDFAELEI